MTGCVAAETEKGVEHRPEEALQEEATSTSMGQERFLCNNINKCVHSISDNYLNSEISLCL